MPHRFVKSKKSVAINLFCLGEWGCHKYQGPNPLLPAAAPGVDDFWAQALVLPRRGRWRLTTTCHIASSSCRSAAEMGACAVPASIQAAWQPRRPADCCLNPAGPAGISSWASKWKETLKKKVFADRLRCKKMHFAGTGGHQPFILGSEGSQLPLLSIWAAAMLLSACQPPVHVPLPGEVRLNPSKWGTLPSTGLRVTSPEKKSSSWVICCKYFVYRGFVLVLLCSNVWVALFLALISFSFCMIFN